MCLILACVVLAHWLLVDLCLASLIVVGHLAKVRMTNPAFAGQFFVDFVEFACLFLVLDFVGYLSVRRDS